MMPHYLLDAAMWSDMQASEKLILVAVLRKTMNKGISCAQPLALTYLANYTGYSSRTVERALDKLLLEGVLIEERPPDKMQPRQLAVQMDPLQWGRYKPSGEEHPEPPPSVVEEPDEGSTLCRPMKIAIKNASIQEQEKEQRQENCAAKDPSPLDDFSYPCDAESELTYGGDMVNAVGHALTQDLVWAFCETCYAASPTLHCDDRVDVCLLAAEDLIARVTSDDVRDKRGYVWAMLHDPNPSPAHLIGWHHWRTLQERDGPWPD